VRRQYHSSQVSTANVTNAAGYKNANVDSWFDQAVQSLDPTVRFNLYHQVQVQVAQDLPYMWMIETPNVRGHTAKCVNFKAWTGLFAESGWCSKLR
jgi:ABC-type transport system substrate-binding protein